MERLFMTLFMTLFMELFMELLLTGCMWTRILIRDFGVMEEAF